ncbi:MAG TPA: ATP-binding cassette domain-containing protein [Mycobacteriales bacterium]|nr:ATP-binding cassette domain-containing protein [Mycobacteriales bacterium]
MIRFEAVSVRYEGADRPVLRDVDLAIPEGELCLVVGRTGSGKTTLLRCINGLVPHFTGGRLAGRVTVDGRDTRTHPPRELADVVGIVGQDPRAGFVTDTVEDELAYGMESLGLPADVMRRRVEETLDLLGLAQLRHRPLGTLSGGQAQRVAIGGALTAHPKVLVLDEPTSALDPGAAEDVLAALQRLVHDLGLTVVVAEHRLERVVHYADRVIYLDRGGVALAGPPAQVLAASAVAPAVVHLGRLAGWSPLPLSVRDARRVAGPLRTRLTDRVPSRPEPRLGPPVARAERMSMVYGPVRALDEVSLTLRRHEIVAVMGRNGAGKSTLLGGFAGLLRPTGGRVSVLDHAPHRLAGRDLIGIVGLVPQDAGDLLYADSVLAECRAADRSGGLPAGSTAAAFADLVGDVDPRRHPRDLSEGQRLALALAVVLAPRPSLLLLDEPTRGLDYPGKTRLVTALKSLAADGHAVLLATHDVELTAEFAQRVVVIADGEVVADGPAHAVVLGSPQFAPQVAKVLAPQPFLTVTEVEGALARVAG